MLMKDNTLQFKIHGSDRKLLKKELNTLKSFAKNFWYYHQLDKDMTSFYGTHENYPMSDDKAKVLYDDTIKKIELLNNKLSELFE